MVEKYDVMDLDSTICLFIQNDFRASQANDWKSSSKKWNYESIRNSPNLDFLLQIVAHHWKD